MSKSSPDNPTVQRSGKPAPSRGGIRKIAIAAGVSISTVSRVINRSKPVSEALRQRVLAVIAREKYVPNFTARSLVYRKTNTIGIAIPVVSPEFHTQILNGADEYLSARGYETLICPMGEDRDGAGRYLDLLARRVTDGLLLMHETRDAQVRSALRGERIPIVLGSVYFGSLRFPAIGIDDYSAANEATRHLLELGHRKIGLVSLSESSTSGKHRIRGYSDAIAGAGIEPSIAHIAYGHYAYESGYYAARQLLKADPKLTAIFAASDEMAVGVLHYLTEAGMAVPDDVSVVGFDDVPMASFTNPPLTTVHQPIKEIGLKSAELLVSLIRGERRSKTRINLPHQLVVRESTGPPRRGSR